VWCDGGEYELFVKGSLQDIQCSIIEWKLVISVIRCVRFRSIHYRANTHIRKYRKLINTTAEEMTININISEELGILLLESRLYSVFNSGKDRGNKLSTKGEPMLTRLLKSFCHASLAIDHIMPKEHLR
jgi:hypothetical protein